MIRIAGKISDSIVDGEGLRYVIFVQGCNHNCLGCQNPNTHDFNGGILITEDELFNEIKSNPIIDGVTLSGGDPFFQADKLINLCKNIHSIGLDIWAYTGFKIEDFLNYYNGASKDKRINDSMMELLRNVDILVDGKFIQKLKTLDKLYVGSSNQRIIDVKKTFINNAIVEYKIVE